LLSPAFFVAASLFDSIDTFAADFRRFARYVFSSSLSHMIGQGHEVFDGALHHCIGYGSCLVFGCLPLWIPFKALSSSTLSALRIATTSSAVNALGGLCFPFSLNCWWLSVILPDVCSAPLDCRMV
jgi:hypothetical protein